MKFRSVFYVVMGLISLSHLALGAIGLASNSINKVSAIYVLNYGLLSALYMADIYVTTKRGKEKADK